MQKNNFHLSATILVFFTLALCLPHSVAELRAAASGPSVDSTLLTDLPARQYFGPRRHQIRQSNVPVTPSDERMEGPSVPSRSLLERLLDESGIHREQRHLAHAVLSLLDESCLEKLETFSILYDHPKHRGLAGKSVILVSGTVPDQEFIGLLLHEGLGHYRDITCLTGTAAAGESEFRDGDDPVYNDDPSAEFYRISWETDTKRKPAAARRDFVTGYAYEADSFEDLAESVTYYMTQEQAFRVRAAKNPILAAKLAWLETYVPKPSAFAEGAEWNGKIAWDATKLSFAWSQNKYTNHE